MQTVPFFCHRSSATPGERKVILPISAKPKDPFLIWCGWDHAPTFRQPLRTGGWDPRMTLGGGWDGNSKEERAAITKSRGKGRCSHTHTHTHTQVFAPCAKNTFNIHQIFLFLCLQIQLLQPRC